MCNACAAKLLSWIGAVQSVAKAPQTKLSIPSKASVTWSCYLLTLYWVTRITCVALCSLYTVCPLNCNGSFVLSYDCNLLFLLVYSYHGAVFDCVSVTMLHLVWCHRSRWGSNLIFTLSVRICMPRMDHGNMCHMVCWTTKWYDNNLTGYWKSSRWCPFQRMTLSFCCSSHIENIRFLCLLMQ